MPCDSRGSCPGEEITTARRALDKATRAACEALKILETLSFPHMRGLSSETLVWWEKHQALDAARTKIKRTRKESERFVKALSERFVKALKKPAPPTSAFKKGLKRYKKAIKTGRVISR